ncbi:hypothetical protein SBA6_400006 [Candidatus Sulfopaludibacter sp. SbA6]|nr:hypothetical protein SBA6_400006 [Candidatus Sulfopaludibacter sp. SbA6]
MRASIIVAGHPGRLASVHYRILPGHNQSKVNYDAQSTHMDLDALPGPGLQNFGGYRCGVQ